jgi:hypothetical protein
MAKTVIGLFDNLTDANSAIAELNTHGFASRQISLVTHQPADSVVDRTPHPAGVAHPSHPVKSVGPIKSASAGTLAGGAAGILTTLTLMAVPGLDLGVLLAAGPIVSVLAGAGAAAAAGGLVGALIGMGTSAPEAEAFKEGVQRGGALVSVTADDDQADHIATILTSHHATDLDHCAAEWENAGWKRTIAPSAPATASNIRTRGKEHPAAPAGKSIYSNPERCTSARIYNP